MALYRCSDAPMARDYERYGIPLEVHRRHVMAEPLAPRTMRKPKAGEWYLSGAIPMAYRAPCDLPYPFRILRLVETRAVTARHEVVTRAPLSP